MGSGPCEIISDVLYFDWPLFVELLDPPGLLQNIISWNQLDPELVDDAEAQWIPLTTHCSTHAFCGICAQ